MKAKEPAIIIGELKFTYGHLVIVSLGGKGWWAAGLEEFEAAGPKYMKLAMGWGAVKEHHGVANNFGDRVSMLENLCLAVQHQVSSSKGTWS